MEDFVEEYKYNNCFWKKSGVLYNHGESKFKEYLSIADMFQAIAKSISNACGTIEKVPSLYKQSDDKNSTRGEGILVILHCIKVLNIELKKLSKNINSIATVIFEKNDSYQSKKQATKMCDDCYKKYQNELTKLSQVKKIYFDTMNKTIKYYLSKKIANKILNGKIDKEL